MVFGDNNRERTLTVSFFMLHVSSYHQDNAFQNGLFLFMPGYPVFIRGLTVCIPVVLARVFIVRRYWRQVYN